MLCLQYDAYMTVTTVKQCCERRQKYASPPTEAGCSIHQITGIGCDCRCTEYSLWSQAVKQDNRVHRHEAAQPDALNIQDVPKENAKGAHAIAAHYWHAL